MLVFDVLKDLQAAEQQQISSVECTTRRHSDDLNSVGGYKKKIIAKQSPYLHSVIQFVQKP